MFQQKILTKAVCIPTLTVSFIYGLALPFFWGNDPLDEYGTLSVLCGERKLWFWAWGILMAGSIILCTQYMYKKYNYKNKFFDVLCVLSFISMCCIAITLGHPVDSWNLQRILHWIATGLFIAFLLSPVALFFILNIKKFKYFKLFTVLSFGILGTFVIIFAVLGKSALMEMVPLAMMQILLFLINFTPVFDKEIK